jgi:hypothetical protein
MNETKKFYALIAAATSLIVVALAYTIAQEYILPDIEGYLERKSYYERTISKKGLDLHKGLYWKEKQ